MVDEVHSPTCVLQCIQPAEKLPAGIWRDRAQRAHLSRQEVRRGYKCDETYELGHEYVATLLEPADALEGTTGAGRATGRFDNARKSFTRALRKEPTDKT